MMNAFGVADEKPLCYVADNCNAAKKANELLVDMTDAALSQIEAVAQKAKSDEPRENSAESPVDEDRFEPDSDVLSALQRAVKKPEEVTDSIGCHAHLLELAVGDAVKVAEVAALLSECRALSRSFKTSSRLKSYVEQAKLTIRFERSVFLPQDVVTRWTSTYRLVDKILDCIDVLEQAHVDAQRGGEANVPGMNHLENVVKKKNRELLERIRNVLQPIAIAVDQLQGDSYPTLCWVQVVVSVLLGRLNEAEEEVCAQDQQLKHLPKKDRPYVNFIRTMRASLETRFLFPPLPLPSGYIPIDYIAAALHHRLKGLEFLRSDNERNCVWAHIVSLVEKEKRHTDDSTQEAEQKPTQTTYSIYQYYSKYVGAPKNALTSAEEEVRAYQSEESQLEDPLQWWKLNQKRFPRLAWLARDYLAVPASSATVERIFSRAGNVQSLKRTRLGSAALNAQTCYKINKPFAAKVKEAENADPRNQPAKRKRDESDDSQNKRTKLMENNQVIHVEK